MALPRVAHMRAFFCFFGGHRRFETRGELVHRRQESFTELSAQNKKATRAVLKKQQQRTKYMGEPNEALTCKTDGCDSGGVSRCVGCGKVACIIHDSQNGWVTVDGVPRCRPCSAAGPRAYREAHLWFTDPPGYSAPVRQVIDCNLDCGNGHRGEAFLECGECDDGDARFVFRDDRRVSQDEWKQMHPWWQFAGE